MNIYLASRYARIDEMVNCAAQIEAAGHTVTSRWINGSHAADTPAKLARMGAQYAQEDIEDIRASDVLIAFTEAPGVQVVGAGRGGRHVEMGLAIGLGLWIIAVGPLENIFTMLPEIVIQYPNWEAFKTKWLAGSVNHEPATERLFQ